MNPEFERWVGKQTFSAHDVPIPDGVKRLMQQAFEGGQELQAAKDASVIEALNELDDAVTP
jgi:hypothetical protein